MYCSESPSMYCHKSLAANTRVSLDFSHPATAPDAGNGFATLFLQPDAAAIATTATAATANSNFFEPIISKQPLLFPVQQNLTARRAALADAGDVNGGPLLQRA